MKPSKPLLIGLTGGIACGKSHLSQALKEHGVTVIDADQISRSLTAPGGAALPDVRAAFGDGVFSGEELDRAKLAQRVFGDEAALKTLNGILHPMVFEAIEQAIHDNHHQPALVLDIPLLYETGYDKRCGAVFCAWAPEATQLERLKERGLIESRQDHEDRRRYILSTTPEGRRILAKAQPIMQQISRDTLAPLNEKEQKTLLALLRKLA